MRKLEAYAFEYQERIAIKIENNASESIAKAQSRAEVLQYAKKDSANIEELRKLLIEK